MPQPTLSWPEVTSSFRILSAYDLAAMRVMQRHQEVRDQIPWLTKHEQPHALLFVSHRWHTPQHPDPDGRDLRAIQDFLRRVVTAVEAMLVGRYERLQLVPTLTAEGDLQAQEIARRMFGFGPFADGSAATDGKIASKLLRDAFAARSDDRPAFREWLARRIGVWLDYVCMPQKPLQPGDAAEFRRSLENLDALVMSSTLVALRDPGDDYGTRGWCASEFFLASGRSFARGLFIDIVRMEQGQDVVLEARPVTDTPGASATAQILADSYQQDLAAFRTACDEWSSFDGPVVDVTPPAVWAEYRSLQGSSFYPAELDPNPFRRLLEAIRNLETTLIERWLMSDNVRTIDIAAVVADCLESQQLHCAERMDLSYLGLVVAGQGWIDALRPLFQAALAIYLDQMQARTSGDRETIPRLLVRLQPIAPDLRALFSLVRPASAAAWHSRLSSGPAGSADEKEVMDPLLAGLEKVPPEFEFLASSEV